MKQALALGDSTDESWPVAVAAVAAAAPELRQLVDHAIWGIASEGGVE